MTKISTLDLRMVTQRRLAQQEIFKRVEMLIPDMPVRNDNRGKRETSYAERQGFLRFIASRVVG